MRRGCTKFLRESQQEHLIFPLISANGTETHRPISRQLFPTQVETGAARALLKACVNRVLVEKELAYGRMKREDGKPRHMPKWLNLAHQGRF
jgi:hypothetical protein